MTLKSQGYPSDYLPDRPKPNWSSFYPPLVLSFFCPLFITNFVIFLTLILHTSQYYVHPISCQHALTESLLVSLICPHQSFSIAIITIIPTKVGFVSHKINTHHSLPVLLTRLFPRLLSPLDLGLCHFSFWNPNPTTSSVCLYILLPSLLPVEGKAFVWH